MGVYTIGCLIHSIFTNQTQSNKVKCMVFHVVKKHVGLPLYFILKVLSLLSYILFCVSLVPCLDLILSFIINNPITSEQRLFTPRIKMHLHCVSSDNFVIRSHPLILSSYMPKIQVQIVRDTNEHLSFKPPYKPSGSHIGT